MCLRDAGVGGSCDRVAVAGGGGWGIVAGEG